MSDERKPLPETGFRCYPAKPESITCNMVILVDQMISWLEAERANGANIKKDGKGQDTIRLTMAETTKQDAKLSHYLRYDDFDPSNKGGYQKRDNVTPMPPTDSDIPFN